MLAMARALLARPQVMVMDEPSMGLSPVFVEKTFELIQDLNRRGIAILLVEQNANMALAIANRGYVLQNGHIVLARLRPKSGQQPDDAQSVSGIVRTDSPQRSPGKSLGLASASTENNGGETVC